MMMISIYHPQYGHKYELHLSNFNPDANIAIKMLKHNVSEVVVVVVVVVGGGGGGGVVVVTISSQSHAAVS